MASKRERIYFRVQKGALVPATPQAASQLRQRGYKVGDILLGDMTKPRNPKFNGLVHKLGCLVTENIDSFSGVETHKAIKRLQLEGKIACDEIGAHIPGFGPMLYLVPRSLSFESMDEAEFQDAAKQLCRFLADRYWPECTAAEIERMAGCMVDE